MRQHSAITSSGSPQWRSFQDSLENGSGQYPWHVERYNRLVLLFLSFFLGEFGVDRLYLGLYVTGLIKLVITVLAIAFIVPTLPKVALAGNFSEALERGGPLLTAGFALGIISALFSFFDYIWIIINILLSSPTVPLQFKKNKQWDSPRSSFLDKMLAVLCLVISIITTAILS